MRETAIIRNLLEQVGPLEHLDETVMQAAWSALTERTNVAGVTPHIDRTPVRLRCRACGGEYEPQDLADLAAIRDDVPLVEVSAQTGEGIDDWLAWLRARMGVPATVKR